MSRWFLLPMLMACAPGEADPTASLPVDQAPALRVATLDTTPEVFVQDLRFTAEVSGVSPGAPVGLAVSTATTGLRACPPALRGVCMGLNEPFVLVAQGTADATGEARLRFTVPPNAPLGRIRAQAVALDSTDVYLSSVLVTEVLDPDGDPDNDGARTRIEVSVGCDPLDPDTDDDGLLDNDEFVVHRTSPLFADTDGDGVDDGDEVAAGTNPTDPTDF